jgi:hypothetical protein
LWITEKGKSFSLQKEINNLKLSSLFLNHLEFAICFLLLGPYKTKRRSMAADGKMVSESEEAE